MLGEHVRVAVRCRPLCARDHGEHVPVSMPSKMNVVVDDKEFAFDRTYWSCNPDDANYATQAEVVQELASDIVASAMKGFNNCLLAYGQTGSGKTYTMMGTKAERGVISSALEGIFHHVDQKSTEEQFTCHASYIEIYRDKIIDLLVPPKKNETATKRDPLEVRHHPTLGTYVTNLTDSAVASYEQVLRVLAFGMKSRTIGCTSMNDKSSRSHAIFTVSLAKVSGNITTLSKVHFVDLAGSERQGTANTTGERLREGGLINKSLTTLALVIQKLCERERERIKDSRRMPSVTAVDMPIVDGSKKKEKNLEHVPFRNSKLTHFLSESLSGNSRTTMFATINPSQSHVAETLSTLRFASSVKKIRTNAHKNEHGNNLVEKLKTEVERLKSCLSRDHQRVRDAETLCEKYARSFAEQLQRANVLYQEQNEALECLGLKTSKMAVPAWPCLVNVSKDPSLTGTLVYPLPLGSETSIGSGGVIKISGLGILEKMCNVEHTIVDGAHIVQIVPCLVSEHGAPVSSTNHSSTLSDNSVRTSGDDCGRKEERGPNEDTDDVEDVATWPRVLLNGHLVTERIGMDEGARLFLGHAHCLVLTMGSQKVEPDEQLLDIALAEIVPAETAEYKQCLRYLEGERTRIGETRVEALLQDIRRLLPFIEEANELTRKLRPASGLRWSIEVLTNLFGAEMPECVVRLWQAEKGATRLRNIVRRTLLPQPTKLQQVALTLKRKSAFAGSCFKKADAGAARHEDAVMTLEVGRFLERVTVMRDMYMDKSGSRASLASLSTECQQPDSDGGSDTNRDSLNADGGLDPWTLGGMATRHADERSMTSARMRALERQCADQQARIEAMERKNAAQMAHHAQLWGGLDGTTRHYVDTSFAAAQLASKLLSDLRCTRKCY